MAPFRFGEVDEVHLSCTLIYFTKQCANLHLGDAQYANLGDGKGERWFGAHSAVVRCSSTGTLTLAASLPGHGDLRS